MMTLEKLISLLPKAVDWINAEEAKILLHGEPLDQREVVIARAAGIREPDKVRLLCVEKILPPADPELLQAVTELNLITAATAGFTAGRGIFIRAAEWRVTWLVAHELKHTSQYLELGTDIFLRTYALQCRESEYLNAPLELDAIAFGNQYRT